jgi:(p)ppGpp synthase/HD superfamily hydrolase
MGMTPMTAKEVAMLAHAGQMDLSGVPYIEHCRRVAERVAALCGPMHPAVVVAWLHDVLEDTHMDEAQLRYYGVTQDQLDAIVAMTHLAHEPREEYIGRVMRNPWAAIVKRCDIADNSDPVRMERLSADKRERLQAKYVLDLVQLSTGSRLAPA